MWGPRVEFGLKKQNIVDVLSDTGGLSLSLILLVTFLC